MAGNRVVARFRDGKRIKGLTTDFVPTRDFFHVSLDDGKVVTVRHLDLKAVFFVRDFAGDPSHRRTNEFPADRPVSGRKIRGGTIRCRQAMPVGVLQPTAARITGKAAKKQALRSMGHAPRWN